MQKSKLVLKSFSSHLKILKIFTYSLHDLLELVLDGGFIYREYVRKLLGES